MTTRKAFSLGFLLLTVVVSLGRSDAETPAKAFWTWLVKNEVRLAGALKSDPAATMDEINGHLQAEKGVIAEAAIAKEAGEKHMLVISADGLVQYFDAVKALVAAAPALQRWQVVAFRPRRDEGQLEITGKTFDVSDFSFRERGRKKGKVDLQIFARKMRAAEEPRFKQAAYLFLDGIVGEYDAETKIGGIEFLPAPAKPSADVRPLTELARVVDSL